MRADWESMTMYPPSVAGMIRYMAMVEPVTVKCSCGSSLWVTDNSSVWHTENFVKKHSKCGNMTMESASGEFGASLPADFIGVIDSNAKNGL